MAQVESNSERSATPTANMRQVVQALVARPHAFDFFQAVRLLTLTEIPSNGESTSGWMPVGHDYTPGREAVRFRALPSHTFPASSIVSFTEAAEGSSQGVAEPAEMTVAFLGLTGPVGALPQHYTQSVIDRIRLKDNTLRNFFDLFNHRSISLFYRAWEKHQVLPLIERALAERREDAFTSALYGLVGMRTPALRGRLECADDVFLHYAGLFAHHPRNAQSLERMVAELFGLPAAVQQFVGQWLRLEPDQQSAMPSSALPDGLNCQLGVTTIAGERVWSIESRFRLRLGPLGYEAFDRLLPGRGLLTEVGQIVRSYAGPELDFDVQLVLRREEVPFCQLSREPTNGPRLGWNTWACSAVRATDADEAIFAVDGRPTR